MLLVCSLLASAQGDLQLVHYKQSNLLYNPATAGEDGSVSAIFLNRNQWSADRAPKQMLFSVDLPADFALKNLGLGLNFWRNQQPLEKMVLVNLNLSYGWKLHWGALDFGLSLGAFDKEQQSGEEEVSTEQGQGKATDSLPKEGLQELGFDVGAGVFLQTKRLQLSLGATHLNQAKVEIAGASYSLTKRHFYLVGAYVLNPSNEMLQLESSFFWKSDFSENELDLQVDALYKDKWTAGLTYRLKEGIIMRLSTRLKNGFGLGYAYDITKPALAVESGGVHEFYVAYNFSLQKKKRKAYKSVRYL